MAQRWDDLDVLMRGEQAVQMAMDLLQMPANLCAAPLEAGLYQGRSSVSVYTSVRPPLMDSRGMQGFADSRSRTFMNPDCACTVCSAKSVLQDLSYAPQVVCISTCKVQQALAEKQRTEGRHLGLAAKRERVETAH